MSCCGRETKQYPQQNGDMKSIKEVCKRPRSHWVGDGFNVFPVFADKAFTNDLSPFLMFDYAKPKDFPPTKKKLGVGRHPHRGFETITVAFQGGVEHADSTGNRDTIGEGDVQWMTAGRGIVHEEYHSREFAKTGGTFEMCQLWLNLPSSKKMVPPAYQPILKDQIPTSPLYESSDDQTANMCSADDGGVRVIAGEFQGVRGPATTHTQVDMWDINLKTTGKAFKFDMVEGNNVIIFCRSGALEVIGDDGGSPLGPQDVAILHTGGTTVILQATEPDSQVLVLAGEPINEPIAAHGPMVMNTQAEIQKAFSDYQSGKFGT